MSVVILVPDYQERWRLDKDAGTAVLTNDGIDRELAYSYDEAVRMIRLARVLGAQPRRGE